MTTTQYTGLFRSAEGHQFELKVNCFGLLQAFFLLTADAIRKVKHYQLYTITSEKGDVYKVDDILNCNDLLKAQ